MLGLVRGSYETMWYSAVHPSTQSIRSSLELSVVVVTLNEWMDGAVASSQLWHHLHYVHDSTTQLRLGTVYYYQNIKSSSLLTTNVFAQTKWKHSLDIASSHESLQIFIIYRYTTIKVKNQMKFL